MVVLGAGYHIEYHPPRKLLGGRVGRAQRTYRKNKRRVGVIVVGQGAQRLGV